MQRILVSACLLGEKVRYDGAGKLVSDDRLQSWIAEGRVVAICPELSGGLPVPRLPAERIGTKIVDSEGDDVTEPFQKGAANALALAKTTGCTLALLKEGSPSCGSQFIADGSFSGTRIAGAGMTAELLSANGIQVFSENQLDELAREIEQRPPSVNARETP
jgi:uncharacterized protein YbbK (DUF523 family)